MTGSRVRDQLRLGSGTDPKPVWGKESQLILHNAVVGSVQDGGEQGAWPQRLGLDGFTYTQLGGLYGEESGSGIAVREAAWFIEWLEKDQTYRPQPYHQLANVLRATGHPKKADDILYAGKERERREAWELKWWRPSLGGLKWWGLSLLKSTIGYGYGYRYFFSLPWVGAITLIGAAVFATTEKGQSSSVAEMLAFSFDLLLPLIKLHESHKITFEGWQRYYFYGHKLMGFVLGSFVVAGLSGITKK